MAEQLTETHRRIWGTIARNGNSGVTTAFLCRVLDTTTNVLNVQISQLNARLAGKKRIKSDGTCWRVLDTEEVEFIRDIAAAARVDQYYRPFDAQHAA